MEKEKINPQSLFSKRIFYTCREAGKIEQCYLQLFAEWYFNCTQWESRFPLRATVNSLLPRGWLYIGERAKQSLQAQAYYRTSEEYPWELQVWLQIAALSKHKCNNVLFWPVVEVSCKWPKTILNNMEISNQAKKLQHWIYANYIPARIGYQLHW